MGTYEADLNKMRWSFSRCHCFENCRYEWYLNYLEVDENGKPLQENEQNFYAAFGGFNHKILEGVFKKELTLDDALQKYIDEFDEQVSEYVYYKTREKYFDAGLKYYSELDLSWLEDYEILGVELECKFVLNGKLFIGYIDLLLRHKQTGKIIVVDHKSADFPIGKRGKVLKNKVVDYKNYKKQLYLYSRAIEEKYGVLPSELWWNYFRVGEWLKLEFKENEYIEALKWADSVVKTIYQEEDFLPHLDRFYCYNLCGFRNSCDYKLMGSDLT